MLVEYWNKMLMAGAGEKRQSARVPVRSWMLRSLMLWKTAYLGISCSTATALLKEPNLPPNNLTVLILSIDLVPHISDRAWIQNAFYQRPWSPVRHHCLWSHWWVLFIQHWASDKSGRMLTFCKVIRENWQLNTSRHTFQLTWSGRSQVVTSPSWRLSLKSVKRSTLIDFHQVWGTICTPPETAWTDITTIT